MLRVLSTYFFYPLALKLHSVRSAQNTSKIMHWTPCSLLWADILSSHLLQNICISSQESTAVSFLCVDVQSAAFPLMYSPDQGCHKHISFLIGETCLFSLNGEMMSLLLIKLLVKNFKD